MKSILTTDNVSDLTKLFQVFGEEENNSAVDGDDDAFQPGEEDQEDKRRRGVCRWV